MALYECVSSEGTSSFTTYYTGNDNPVTGLTIGNTYIFNISAASISSVTGGTILYQEKSTGAIGSRYQFTVIVKATSSSITLSGSSLASAKIVTLVD